MFAKQALCIGNNSYVPSSSYLPSCINDANDLSNSLQSIGFQSYVGIDLDLISMASTLLQFIDSIQEGSVAIFYFSGHGAQYHGKNYLIPTNATGITAENIKFRAIDAQMIIDDMYTKKPRLIICILDCCRTDESEDSTSNDKAARKPRLIRGAKGGLAPMGGLPSTIIAYACAANASASAKSLNNRNSLYTYYLLRHIRTPNVDIETVLKFVAADVQENSDDAQVPYRYSSFNDIIFLVPNQTTNALFIPQCAQRMECSLPTNKPDRKPSGMRRSASQQNLKIEYQPNGQNTNVRYQSNGQNTNVQYQRNGQNTNVQYQRNGQNTTGKYQSNGPNTSVKYQPNGQITVCTTYQAGSLTPNIPRRKNSFRS